MFDVIIIGAGPAGMTAGIYTARKNLKTLVWTRDIGGQTATSSNVENYPGFTMLSGAELIDKFERHLEEFKDSVELRLNGSGIAKIERNANGHFVVTTVDGQSEQSRAVIIAGGKVPRELGVPGESEFLNRGVTYCAWCDGPLFAGKDVAIIGGGNAALDAALNVAKFVRTIYLINNLKQLTAEPLLVEKAKAAPNVRIMNNSTVNEIRGDKLVNSVTVTDHDSGLDKPLAVEGVFIEIGSLPATKYLKNFIELDENGEIVIDNNNMTSLPGVFAAGDITNVAEKQIVIAAGEGAKAAISASRYLSKT